MAIGKISTDTMHRGPSAIAELLVVVVVCTRRQFTELILSSSHRHILANVHWLSC